RNPEGNTFSDGESLAMVPNWMRLCSVGQADAWHVASANPITRKDNTDCVTGCFILADTLFQYRPTWLDL
ncbi:MAG: hypothetical protein AB2704_02155, partial [Candidatus Thiodiazotropha taylori]